MEDLLPKLGIAVDQIAKMLADKAPEAATAVIRVVQIKGILTLALATLAAAMIALVAAKMIRLAMARLTKDECDDPGIFMMIAGIILSVVSFVVFAANVFSPGNWIAAIDGKYGLAYKILDKLL